MLKSFLMKRLNLFTIGNSFILESLRDRIFLKCLLLSVSKAVVVQVVKISLRLSYFKSLQHYVSWGPVQSPRIGRESVSNNYVKRALTLLVNLVPRPSFFLVSENEEGTRKTNWLSFWMGYNDFNASHESNTSLIKKIYTFYFNHS